MTNTHTFPHELIDQAVSKVQAHLREGNTFRNKTDYEKFVQAITGNETAGVDKAVVREIMEFALIGMYRSITGNPYLHELSKLEKIIQFYSQIQPGLTHRSSQTVLFQQYSTPAPLSFLAGLFTGIEQAHRVLEPSAGNGLLVIGAQAKNCYVNDSDPVRRYFLRKGGFGWVSGVDAEKPQNFAEQGWHRNFEVVHTNPPFGKLTNKVRIQGYLIANLEHYMASLALEALMDKGKAAIIIGGHTEFDDRDWIKAGRLFFNYLYHYYHVADMINVEGDLYAKQGTKFPIRLLLISGRKQYPQGFAPFRSEELAKVETDFYAIYERIKRARAWKPEDKPQPAPVTLSEREMEPAEETGSKRLNELLEKVATWPYDNANRTQIRFQIRTLPRQLKVELSEWLLSQQVNADPSDESLINGLFKLYGSKDDIVAHELQQQRKHTDELDRHQRLYEWIISQEGRKASEERNYIAYDLIKNDWPQIVGDILDRKRYSLPAFRAVANKAAELGINRESTVDKVLAECLKETAGSTAAQASGTVLTSSQSENDETQATDSESVVSERIKRLREVYGIYEEIGDAERMESLQRKMALAEAPQYEDLEALERMAQGAMQRWQVQQNQQFVPYEFTPFSRESVIEMMNAGRAIAITGQVEEAYPEAIDRTLVLINKFYQLFAQVGYTRAILDNTRRGIVSDVKDWLGAINGTLSRIGGTTRMVETNNRHASPQKVESSIEQYERRMHEGENLFVKTYYLLKGATLPMQTQTVAELQDAHGINEGIYLKRRDFFLHEFARELCYNVDQEAYYRNLQRQNGWTEAGLITFVRDEYGKLLAQGENFAAWVEAKDFNQVIKYVFDMDNQATRQLFGGLTGYQLGKNIGETELALQQWAPQAYQLFARERTTALEREQELAAGSGEGKLLLLIDQLTIALAS